MLVVCTVRQEKNPATTSSTLQAVETMQAQGVAEWSTVHEKVEKYQKVQFNDGSLWETVSNAHKFSAENDKRDELPAGLEPATLGSEVQSAIHYAMRAVCHST